MTADSASQGYSSSRRGGVPPYKFVILVFSGKSSIDANGLYTAQLAAATRLDDTVVVTDSVGTRASSTVTITCS